MNRTKTILGSLVLFVGVCGCGDTPAKVIRDIYSTRNEMADMLFLANDEDTAKYCAEVKVERLKKKWETVKKRYEDYLGDKEYKRDMKAAYLENKAEYDATDRRVQLGIQRLERLRGPSMGRLIGSAQTGFTFSPDVILQAK